MSNNGFKTFIIYVSVVAHFNSSKYNVLNGLLNKKSYVTTWNEKRFNRDGILFQIIADKFKGSDVLKLFTTYFYYNQDKVHPNNIINDNFELWYKTKDDFNFMDINYQYDILKLMEYCVNHNIKMKDVINSNTIFKFNFKLPTMVILNHVFNINVISKSNLETKLIKKRKLYLDKTSLIFYNDILNKDWKGITKSIIKKGYLT